MKYSDFKKQKSLFSFNGATLVNFKKLDKYNYSLEISLMGRKHGVDNHVWYVTYLVLHSADAYEVYNNMENLK